MIKINQLLKDSFTTYKQNFNKIFWIALPILVLSVISEYYITIFTAMVDNGDFSNIFYLLTTLGIYFICVLIVALYFGPVLNRVIQKKEDGESFDTKAAYAFQKKNIFKWIMVNVWGVLYMVRVLWLYILISVLLLASSVFLKNPTIVSVANIISLIVLSVGLILNITKFVLYKNIYFSKDNISARDAVRESMELGKTKNNQVWMLILALLISTIIIIVIYSILGFIIAFLSKLLPDISGILENILTAFVSVLFFLPWMSIIIAKGYVQIRG